MNHFMYFYELVLSKEHLRTFVATKDKFLASKTAAS